eukprot:CAMPEP_0198230292 /NCGR_PEP_ID=MMETSP1445-20131203/114585_1 /TAXON_ID=36898 /ORGANISM="Pyramimonas sp., Strain CCMP2087" /LENGTH=240 /DNA_ID=CAMNT_0043910823 /DNA_START=388 /DNA_END=1111 /DNA_ORIENTATION=-
MPPKPLDDDLGGSLDEANITPYEFLGVEPGCAAEEAKEAFRDKMKIYHPDVYKGTSDASRITARLLLAYDIIKDEVGSGGQLGSLGNYAAGKFAELDPDPFGDPKGPVDRIFVNELKCIGRSCYSSCVDKMPEYFEYNAETARARCTSTDAIGDAIGEDEGAYKLFVAVSQCPRTCIHYVTKGQQKVLQEMLQGAVDGTNSVNEVDFRLFELITKAEYENGRERKPKRKPKRSSKWVDWF